MLWEDQTQSTKTYNDKWGEGSFHEVTKIGASDTNPQLYVLFTKKITPKKAIRNGPGIVERFDNIVTIVIRPMFWPISIHMEHVLTPIRKRERHFAADRKTVVVINYADYRSLWARLRISQATTLHGCTHATLENYILGEGDNVGVNENEIVGKT